MTRRHVIVFNLPSPSTRQEHGSHGQASKLHGFNTKTRNNAKINNQTYYVARFFALIMNMPLVLVETLYIGKNDNNNFELKIMKMQNMMKLNKLRF
jgi:hypothetical protein